ncbi:hypothetical protein ACIBG0_13670 [Nocardia sp. NPDC050630]|uniref:hypothetical protein n=1 Tax=Nocardia sp. NPDC050630 TaxID=3364321 RepID=UPI0037938C82
MIHRRSAFVLLPIEAIALPGVDLAHRHAGVRWARCAVELRAANSVMLQWNPLS